jgi:multidrug efflux pump
MLVFSAVILVSIWFMFTTSRNELAPTEDQSILFFQALGPDRHGGVCDHLCGRDPQGLRDHPRVQRSFILVGMGAT